MGDDYGGDGQGLRGDHHVEVAHGAAGSLQSGADCSVVTGDSLSSPKAGSQLKSAPVLSVGIRSGTAALSPSLAGKRASIHPLFGISLVPTSNPN